MFYYLYTQFPHIFNLFHYITFRTAYASLTALFLSMVLGPWVIRKLKEFQIGQYIREFRLKLLGAYSWQPLTVPWKRKVRKPVCREMVSVEYGD